jgi:hypothetical protein
MTVTATTWFARNAFPTLTAGQGQLLGYVRCWTALPERRISLDPTSEVHLTERDRERVSLGSLPDYEIPSTAASRYVEMLTAFEQKLLAQLGVELGYPRSERAPRGLSAHLAQDGSFRDYIEQVRPGWLEESRLAEIVIDELAELNMARTEADDLAALWARQVRHARSPIRPVGHAQHLNQALRRLQDDYVMRIHHALRTETYYGLENEAGIAHYFDSRMRRDSGVLSLRASVELYVIGSEPGEETALSVLEDETDPHDTSIIPPSFQARDTSIVPPP